MKRSHSIFNADDIDAAQKLSEGLSLDVWREMLDQSRLGTSSLSWYCHSKNHSIDSVLNDLSFITIDRHCFTATRKCCVAFDCNDIASDAAGPALWSTGLDTNDPDYIAKLSFTRPSSIPSNQVGDIVEGTVKFWNPDKGYGFITAQNGTSSTDYYFNRSSTREGNGGACMSKAKVTFTIAKTTNGLKALDIVHTSCPHFMNGIGTCHHIYDGVCMYSHRIDESFVEEYQRLAAKAKAARLEEQTNHWYNVVAMSEPEPDDLDICCIDCLDLDGDVGGRPEEEATAHSRGPRFMQYPFEPYTMGADEGMCVPGVVSLFL